MKKFYLTILLFFIIFSIRSQSNFININTAHTALSPLDSGVNFISDSIIVDEPSVKDTLILFYLTNSSDNTIDVYWKLEKPVFNNAWESQLCDSRICYGFNKDQSSVNKPNKVAPGDTMLWTIHIFTHETPDSGMAVLKIYDDNKFSNVLDTLPIILNFSNSSATIDIFNTDNLKIFPNPASDFINLEFSMKKALDTDIFITDAVGRVIKQIDNMNNIFNYSKNIDISGFEQGIYFLNIKTKYGILSRKILKY